MISNFDLLYTINNFFEVKIDIKKLTVNTYIVLVGAEKKIHQTSHVIVTHAKTCIGYIDNYDKNRCL